MEKTTNPKDLLGQEKLPLHLWPASATYMGALALFEGYSKYGRMNWRASEVSASVYVAALKRHMEAWFEGQDDAPDSGLPHLGHALACLAILVDAQTQGTLVDDRQFGDFEKIQKLAGQLTKKIPDIREKYADKAPKHWSRVDSAEKGVTAQVYSPPPATRALNVWQTVRGTDELGAEVLTPPTDLFSDDLIAVELRGGVITCGPAHGFGFGPQPGGSASTDIMRYKITQHAPAPPWVNWCGGFQPVPSHQLVEVRYRARASETGLAKRFCWEHTAADDDIVAYRVLL